MNSLPEESSHNVLVSVIVPCYNAEKTVDATIDSILGNARDEISIELIAIDDHSSDGTMRHLRSRGDSIKIIALERNSGVSRARNAGLDAANGHFIAFCDADDIWEPEKLSTQIPLFRDPEVGLVCSSTVIFNETGVIAQSRRRSQKFKRGWVYCDLLSKNFIATSSVVLRREVLNDHRFNVNLTHAEDLDLWLRVTRYWKVDYVNLPLVRYRLSQSQASKNWIAMHESRILIISRNLLLIPKCRCRDYILAGALFAFSMEYWDARDFLGARRKLLSVVKLNPCHLEAWFRMLATLIPDRILRKILNLKNAVSRVSRWRATMS